MEIYDAGVGDEIDIPGHHPRRVKITGWASAADIPPSYVFSLHGSRGEFAHVSWQGSGPWAGLRGTTLLSEGTAVEMITAAGPDNPIRKQYEAAVEASLAALLGTEGTRNG